MFWTTNDFRRIVTFKIRNKQVYMKKNINIQHQGGGLGIRGTNSRKNMFLLNSLCWTGVTQIKNKHIRHKNIKPEEQL